MSIVLALLLAAATPQSRADTVDVIVAGGTVYDGTGTAGRVADVGIRGDRIVFVGVAPAGTVARLRIDARGLIVSPGFIDPHTHTYEGLPRLNAERRHNACRWQCWSRHCASGHAS